jgi:hypothetical protein
LWRTIHDLSAPFPHGIGIAISGGIAIEHDPLVGQRVCRGGNMRQIAIVSFAIVISGCGFLPPQPSSVPERPLSRADIQNAKEIIVTVGDSSPVSRSWSSFRCVFQESGKCYGETSHYQEYATKASEQSRKITHEFPQETFRDVQKVLLESKFLSLKPGQQDFIFEGSKGVAVECGGRSLGVTWGDAGDCKECQPLCEFIDKLRAQVTSPE